MNKLLIFIFLFFYISSLLAQLPIKRDDFTGTTKKNWWQYDLEGTADPTSIVDGTLRFRLPNADDTNPWCNTSLWDGYNMYGSVTVTIRARATTPVRPGSRGWGLWYTSPLSDPTTQAWFMDVGDDPSYPDYNADDVWWRASVANMYLMPDPWLVELDISESILQWHTYKIVRDFEAENEYTLYIDDVEVLSSDIHISQNLSVQIWNDNLVYTRDPFGYLQREWAGGEPDEFVVDFIEVLTEDHPGKRVVPNGIVRLREIPFEMGTTQGEYEWKNYSFSAPSGRCLILLTARAEQYGTYGDDDDVKIQVENFDYGWNSVNSINGMDLDGKTKTVMIDTVLGFGNKNIQINGKNSPVLYDVTIIGSDYGNIILKEIINETATGGDNALFRSYSFYCKPGEVAFYISGTADEDLTPIGYGRYYSRFNDNEDDDVRVEIDGIDYGWQNENAIWGNRLFGESKSILIVENLEEGMHTLNIYTNQTPTLHSVVIYGQNEDNPLPIELQSFSIILRDERILVKWITSSEINNVGFNLYRYIGKGTVTPDQNNFQKINDKIINGAGSSSTEHLYEFEDLDIRFGYTHWYILESVDYDGTRTWSEMKSVVLEEKLPKTSVLYQNYPNPFNSHTTIAFEINKSANIKLEIVNVLGENIITLKNGYLDKGTYTFNWNGKNHYNKDLPSGVYIYQLSFSGQNISKKMLLIR